MRPGDLISGFMKRIGLADHVIVVLSDKYLRSPYCMTELHYIYQRSFGEKEDFLYRIFPLRLTDAQLRHMARSRHLRRVLGSRVQGYGEHFRHLAEADFRLYKAMQASHYHQLLVGLQSSGLLPGIPRLAVGLLRVRDGSWLVQLQPGEFSLRIRLELH